MILVLMYADDTVIFANSATGLQKALDDLEKYCSKWKLTPNPQKTKGTIFGKPEGNRDAFHFTYSGSALDIADCFKYLAHLFMQGLCTAPCRGLACTST